MPNVSIIVPMHNKKRYLAETIDSVLGQTYRDYEIILIDDGSTDNTQEIAKRYVAEHPGVIRYLYQTNRGPGAARNTGMRSAAGRYIAFIDADDAWLPSKLERQVAMLDADPAADLVYCDFYYIDEDRKILVPGYIRRYELPRGSITADLVWRYFMFTSSVVMRRECVDAVGYFREDLFIGEDYDYFLRLTYACRVELLDEKQLEKRCVKGSLSNRHFILNLQNDVVILQDFLDAHPEFLRKHRDMIVRRMGDSAFSLGYYWLKNGRNARALSYFLHSLRYRIYPKTFKCILLCAIPYDFILYLKRLAAGRDGGTADGSGEIGEEGEE